jgi:hypothetical protein
LRQSKREKGIRVSPRTILIIIIAVVLLVTANFYFRSRIGEQDVPAETVENLTTHASDGKGTATVEPAGPVSALSWGTWTITYVAGQTGIATGGGIVFQVSPFWEWSNPQNMEPDYHGYTTITSNNKDAKFDIQLSNFHHIIIRLAEGELAGSDTVRIIYGDTGNGKHPRGAAVADRYAEREEEFFLKVDGNGDNFFVPIEVQPSIDILAAPASRLIVGAPTITVVNSSFDIRITATDVLDNWDRTFTGTGSLSYDGEGLILPAEWEILPEDSGLTTIRATVTGEGKYRIHAENSDGTMEGISNPVTCLAKKSMYNLYWGDLQGHSGLTDGSATPEEYYAYAKYVSCLDVCSLTDHDAHGLLPIDRNSYIWDRIVTTTNSFNSPGEFVTFVGYEWTSWTYGHRHVLFPGDEGKIFSFRDPISDTPDKLGELLVPWKAIAIPHHPGGGPIAVDWDHHSDKYEPLVEICSVHGNSDAPGEPLQIYQSVEDGFVTSALQRGYKLGILASGDTHDGHPGRKSSGSLSMGIAGIWAGSLDRDGIWEALLARRTYGTSGEKILLQFRIDGHWMGEIVQLSEPRDAEFFLFVIGTSSIKKIEILKNETVVKSFFPGNNAAVHQFPMNIEPSSFYRVRMLQEDEGMAWSSPIWFTDS